MGIRDSDGRYVRLAISRPAVYAGLRAATATVLPLIVAELTGQRALQWTALGGWLTSLVDNGGTYRARARVMAAFLLAGAAAAGLGTLLGGEVWGATLAALLVAWTGGMLRVYGDAGASLGVLLTVVFCSALGSTAHTAGAALVTAGLFGAGALGAMALALMIWPVRPYGPAREALAEAYHALAEFARQIARTDRVAAKDGEAWHALVSRSHAPVRVALEHARSVLAEARARRPGASDRADQLLRLYDRAEQMFAMLAAVAEELATAPPVAAPSDGTPSVSTRAGDVLFALADTLDAAEAVLTAGRRRLPSHLAAEVLDAALLRLWQETEDDLAIAAAGASSASAARAVPLARGAALLEEAATQAQTAEERARVVRSGEQLKDRDREVSDDRVAEPPRALPGFLPVHANFTPRSIVFRHAVRLAIVVALAVAFTTHFHIPYGQWVAITALVVLQPYPGATARRGVQRVLGTVGGGAMAALLAAVIRSPLVIAGLMFPLSVAAIALRPVHYGAFTFFLTPVFVLTTGEATGDWRLAGLRILGTAAGGALALLASRVMWPSWEGHSLPAQFAAALDASRHYLRETVRADGRTAAERDRALVDARRRLGLAGNNAEAALQRSLGEPRGRWADVEALMAYLAHLRRLNGAITVLAVSPAVAASPDAVTDGMDAVLADLVDAVREGRAPRPLPPELGTGSATSIGELAALDRVLRQARRMHAATAALTGDRAAAAVGEQVPAGGEPALAGAGATGRRSAE